MAQPRPDAPDAPTAPTPLSPTGSATGVLVGVAVAAIAVPLLVSAALHKLAGGVHLPSSELHSTFEVFGCALGIIVAVLVMQAAETGRSSQLRWLACALLGSEVLDLFHASVRVDDAAFVWSHLVGGVLFGVLALRVWFPETKVAFTGPRVPALVALASTLLGVVVMVATRGMAPLALEGEASPAVWLLGVLSSVLTLAAAAILAVRYHAQRSRHDLQMLVLCLTFGVAGVIAQRAGLWSPDFWLEHGVRLAGESACLALTFLASSASVDRLRDEKARTASVAVYTRSLIEASVDPLMTIGVDGRISDVNAAAIAATGAHRDALVGSDFADWFTAPNEARAAYQRGFREGAVRDVTLDLRHLDGQITSVSYNASVYRDETGGVAGLFGVARDVTATRLAEGEARKANEYARSLIEASIDPLMTIGADGRIADVNGAAEQATGLDRAQLIGTPFVDRFASPDLARVGYQTAFREGWVRDYPLEMRHASGAIRSVSYNASVFRDADGSVAGVFAVARDVSATKAAEWLKDGIARLNATLRSDDDPKSLASKTINELCGFLDATVGVIYLAEEDSGVLALVASYAYTTRKNLSTRFAPGEGLVGQAALEQKQIVLTQVPGDYIRVVSGLGETSPRRICVTPVVFGDHVSGILEIGTLHELDDNKLAFLAQAAHVFGIAIETSRSRARLTAALERSQRLGEELQVQQEELQASNEELQAQSNALALSERTLQTQQEELRVANEELTDKNDLLERQKRDVERTQRDIAQKATELETASRYKSEFLANMSHELRTPLNSLLLLSRGLSENKTKNLTDEQVECASVIYGAGTDLLSLINEILDLSKIEAGHMDISVLDTSIEQVADTLREGFAHVAAAQGLELAVTLDDGLPPSIATDAKRLHQILKNLVSNALKFTEQGGVRVRFHRPAAAAPDAQGAFDPQQSVAVSVTDTGIGIAPEHQQRIFEAFQQVDGGIARRYGGTGLGLSISRELVRLLGGQLRLVSEVGVGSTFTLILPVERKAAAARPAPSGAGAAPVEVRAQRLPRPRGAVARIADIVADDRDKLVDGDACILVVDDDSKFGRILVSRCHDHGFKCVVASTGEDGLALARRLMPHAVLLDIGLPGIDGWQVLRALKDDPRTRHIPVHVISAEEPSTRAARQGAIGHAGKPTSSEMLDAAFSKIADMTSRKDKRVLVVESDVAARKAVVALLARPDVRVDEVGSAREAIEAIGREHYDCMVIDVGPGHVDGDDILEALRSGREGDMPPVVVYTARDVSPEQELRLREYTDSIILKTVRSEERLLDEVSLFLHRVVGASPAALVSSVAAVVAGAEVEGSATVFEGRKVLIVDDDMRSSFALSRMLREHGLVVVKAENGAKALAALDAQPDIAVVLMDVMMPVMDGFDAIRRIRAQDRFARLPILTLTAKAMLGDREKCIAAGANDYLTKPVDPDRLLSALRVWLYG